MHVQYVRPRKRVEIPHVVKEFFPREHNTGLTHKALEQCKLFEREWYLFTLLLHCSCGGVHLQGSDFQHDRLLGCRAAQNRVDACQELLEGKWFYYIVVRPFVEEVLA